MTEASKAAIKEKAAAANTSTLEAALLTMFIASIEAKKGE